MKKPTILWTLFLILSPALATADPSIVFGERSVEIGGLTPGGEAFVIGVSKTWQAWKSSIVTTAETLVDDDDDESVELTLPEDLSTASLWVAVDLSTGGWAVGAPEGSPARTAPLGAERVGSPVGGERIRFAARSLELVVIRPAVGAWRVTVSDFAPLDHDGKQDGRVEASLVDVLSRFTDLIGTPDSGDLIVAIEPYRLEWFVSRLEDIPLELDEAGVAP